MSLTSRIDNSNSNLIYLDLTLSNRDEIGDKPPVFVSFVANRDVEIIDRASDYEISVVRFVLDTPTLPLLMPIPLVGQANINRLTYSVTLQYQNNSVQQYLTFIPQNVNAQLPNPPLIQPDLSTGYYELYSYTHFINIVNNAFQSAYNSLAGMGALPSNYAPYLEFDPTTTKCILNADILGYELGLANPIKIFMNTPLYNLFSSFDAYNDGYSGTTLTGKNFQIDVRNINNGNIYTTSSPAVNWVQVYQEYPTLGVIGNPFDSIVFTTASLPIQASVIAQPININATNPNTENLNKKTLKVLTDLQVPLDAGWETKSRLYYSPSAEYRMVSLLGEDAVRSYDFSVYWKSTAGIYYPFYLSAGCSCGMKIMFRKKPVYSN